MPIMHRSNWSSARVMLVILVVAFLATIIAQKYLKAQFETQAIALFNGVMDNTNDALLQWKGDRKVAVGALVNDRYFNVSVRCLLVQCAGQNPDQLARRHSSIEHHIDNRLGVLPHVGYSLVRFGAQREIVSSSDGLNSQEISTHDIAVIERLKRGETVFRHVEPVREAHIVKVFAPIYEDSRVIGALIVEFNESKSFQRIVQTSRIGKTGTTQIVDQDRNILAQDKHLHRPENGALNQPAARLPLDAAAMIDQAIANAASTKGVPMATGFFHYTDARGYAVAAQARWFENLGIGVIVSVAEHEFYSVLRNMRAITAIFAVIAVAIALFAQAHVYRMRRVLQGEIDGYLNELETRVAARTNALNLARESLKSANRDLREAADTDALTGLANRRRFNEVNERVWTSYSRRYSSAAILMIDIDHFKKINDRYGHLVGDDCLAEIGRAIASVQATHGKFRSLARYGGEEFIVLITDVSPAGAMRIAEDIRTVITAARVEVSLVKGQRVSLALSASVGVACTHSFNVTSAELIARADQALYAAKQAGRNRVKLFYQDVALPRSDRRGNFSSRYAIADGSL